MIQQHSRAPGVQLGTKSARFGVAGTLIFCHLSTTRSGTVELSVPDNRLDLDLFRFQRFELFCVPIGFSGDEETSG